MAYATNHGANVIPTSVSVTKLMHTGTNCYIVASLSATDYSHYRCAGPSVTSRVGQCHDIILYCDIEVS